MVEKCEEYEAFDKKIEEGEVGIAELLEFYTRVEGIYVSAAGALVEGQTVITSSTTNSE